MSSERAVDAYYGDVRDVELLNPELERRLFHEYRTCGPCARTYVEAATQVTCPACGAKRNLRAREKLVEGALRFVVKVARDYARKVKGDRHGEDLLMTLVSAGNLGLLVAVDRFQTEKGTRFLTYAAWWVREKILEELDNMGVVRVPSYQQKAQRARWKRSNGEPEAPYVTLEPVSVLDQGHGDDTAEANYINKYGASAISDILRGAGVSTRDHYVVMLYLGSREAPRSLRQIAVRVGYTPERIRAVKRSAMNILRNTLTKSAVRRTGDVFT